MSDQGDEEFDEEMDEGMDPGQLLGSLLMDDDGRNMINALDDIRTQLEMTNKLLLKLVAHLTKPPVA
jgi:hypothetical protein